MFKVQERKITRGCAEHIKAGLGCATDYKAVYEILEIWFDGIVDKTFFGPQGGNWLYITDSLGRSFQFAHLKTYFVRVGDKVRKGDQVAITGNTGGISTGPHLHLQVIQNGKRLNPEQVIEQQLSTPTMDFRKHHVKMIYLTYGLVPVDADLNYWSGQSDSRIMNDLPYELCKRVDADGTASSREDYFNKIAKSWIGRDFTVDECERFSKEKQPLRYITDYCISEKGV